MDQVWGMDEAGEGSEGAGQGRGVETVAVQE